MHYSYSRAIKDITLPPCRPCDLSRVQVSASDALPGNIGLAT
jgi:hypothetical protein